MSRRNMFLLFACGLFSGVCYLRAEQNPYARYVAAGYSVIDSWALEDIDDQRLFEGAMYGMVAVLRDEGDDHTQFVDEDQKNLFREELTQEFGGVGIHFQRLGDPPVPVVLGPPLPGTPAYAADMRAGDRIVKIEGKPTENLKDGEVQQLMRGPVGQPVTVTVQRPGIDDPLLINLTRAIITVESIYGDIRDENGQWQFYLEQDPRIGYIQINSFGDKTEDEIIRTLAALSEQGTKALILDVRDNYGGSLDAAVGISDLFLRAGQPIVTTRDRLGKIRDRFVSTDRGGYDKIPLAILINNQSASASEILAAALQDYHRGRVIGDRTYGKGTVQRLLRLESGRSILKLTTATYWRPSGKNIHRMRDVPESGDWGVSPDAGFEVDLDKEQYELWHKYRRHRRFFGNRVEGLVIDELNAENGKLPEDYVDRALQLAVDDLSKRLD